jgi:hypothetical protein
MTAEIKCYVSESHNIVTILYSVQAFAGECVPSLDFGAAICCLLNRPHVLFDGRPESIG